MSIAITAPGGILTAALTIPSVPRSAITNNTGRIIRTNASALAKVILVVPNEGVDEAAVKIVNQ